MTGEDEKIEIQQGSWVDIREHLERDAVVSVSEDLNLMEVAEAVIADRSEQVGRWIDQGLVGKPSFADLDIWEKDPNRPFLFVIAQPYVLIQKASQ